MRKWFIFSFCLALAGVGGFLASPYVTGQTKAPPLMPRDAFSYSGVVQKVLPAVVSIEAKATSPKISHSSGKNRGLDESQIPEEFRKFFDMFPKSEGRQFQSPDTTPHNAFGSGFIVDPKGVIMTNYHVVKGASEVVVQLQDGQRFTSKDIKSDPKTDLAIVRIESKSALPYLEMGDSESMQIGDRVLAVGAPFRLTGTVTSGIVSAKGRSLHMNMYEDYLQTDAAINPGNSGGPLVNMEGKVIGINTAIKSASGGSDGIGLAITSNLAQNVMKQLLSHGVVHRGYLGVQVRPLDPAVAARLGVADGKGVVVAKVFDNTPAAKAGIHAGDVVTAISGKEVKDVHDVQQRVADAAVGKKVEMSIVRDGAMKNFAVTVEEQPTQFGTTASSAPETPQGDNDSKHLEKMGIEMRDMTPALAEEFGFKDKSTGAVVVNVDANSIAADAGMQRGMLIVKVDKQTVASAAAAKDALSKASLDKGILLEVRTADGALNYVVLKSNGN